MKVLVNGNARELPEGATIAALLAELDLGAAAVAVERNQHLVPRKEHATAVLAEGDRIELVTLVGGG